MGTTVTEFVVRPLEAADQPATLDLINADRLPGQPEVTESMLADALAGRSSVDTGWWADLDAPRTVVATDIAGQVAGAASFATRARDGAGLILWLHARENRVAVKALLRHMLNTLHGCRVIEAFSFATALGLGLEALPVRHRPVTAAALIDAGFTSSDLWRYMGRSLPAELPTAAGVRIEASELGIRELALLDGERTLAQATVGVPVAGIGVLWWISSDPDLRGRGHGRAMLGSALQLLGELGAREVILFVDDDEPGGERDRTAADRLYEQSGFVEYDRLHSYRLER
ncbi:GNAT family N-acetyltransferase [Amycolatopsis sp. GM8]|uniref:GNAT family N-acetyltransferase n=1 Tax=Amycolatopsis sp. GM8 TaxID=2896530 RepID=UPI001F46C4CC|nr:GNAT family N-acetyltransferase [Amycolatopsis sp. GM8]